MAIIDMMLSKDDDAAKWMTVAMEICHNKNLEDVWEGLCRLLLPAGKFCCTGEVFVCCFM